MQPFTEKLRLLNGSGLKRRSVDVLQVNLGRYCNLACIHCHVEAGPTRKELMSRENVDAVLRFLCATGIATLDITGGAPELHPEFDYLVESARGLGRQVIDRCNLTVIFEPGKDYLPEFLRQQRSRAGLFVALLFQRQCRQAARQGHIRRKYPGAANS